MTEQEIKDLQVENEVLRVENMNLKNYIDKREEFVHAILFYILSKVNCDGDVLKDLMDIAQKKM